MGVKFKLFSKLGRPPWRKLQQSLLEQWANVWSQSWVELRGQKDYITAEHFLLLPRGITTLLSLLLRRE